MTLKVNFHGTIIFWGLTIIYTCGFDLMRKIYICVIGINETLISNFGKWFQDYIGDNTGRKDVRISGVIWDILPVCQGPHNHPLIERQMIKWPLWNRKSLTMNAKCYLYESTWCVDSWKLNSPLEHNATEMKQQTPRSP